MTPSSKPLLLAALCAGLVVAGAPAKALLATCTASASGVAFGGYDPTNAGPTDSTGVVTVTCSALVSLLVSYTIALSPGGSGAYASRKLHLASDLGYNLFTGPNYSQVWGDGSGATGTVADGYLLGLFSTMRSYSVYGRIPAGQNVPPGGYSDVIVVTVTY